MCFFFLKNITQNYIFFCSVVQLTSFLYFTGDFIVLLFVSRQSIVFKIEKRHIDTEYPGGTNRSIIEEAEKPSFVNPVPDFVSHIRFEIL